MLRILSCALSALLAGAMPASALQLSPRIDVGAGSPTAPSELRGTTGLGIHVSLGLAVPLASQARAALDVTHERLLRAREAAIDRGRITRDGCSVMSALLGLELGGRCTSTRAAPYAAAAAGVARARQGPVRGTDFDGNAWTTPTRTETHAACALGAGLRFPTAASGLELHVGIRMLALLGPGIRQNAFAIRFGLEFS
jgi:hypothetical protein